METLSRRDFTQQALGSLVTFSLLETIFRHDAFADAIKPITLKWLRDVNQLGFDVKGQKVTQVDWQKKIEELYKQVDLPDLLQLIDFDKLTANVQLQDNGARSLRLKFAPVEGVPEKLAFGGQVFALKKGRSVVPHGHNNMATAFLILKGEFHGRHFDRVKDEAQHLIIKPTIDRKFTVGESSTVSDDKDNIHWFQALGEPAYIFNIHVLNVRSSAKEATGRVYLDPNGEKLKDGLIRARRIDYTESHKLYG